MRTALVAAALASLSLAATPGFSIVDPVLTPYLANGTLNLALVPALAAASAAAGVDVVLLGGSNGEWPSLSVDERLQLLGAWSSALRSLPPLPMRGTHGRVGGKGPAGMMRLMVHVGHTDLSAACSLARAAEAAGADSVLSVSPGVVFAPPTVEDGVADLAAIAACAPATPFYFYHYPAIYHVDFPMAQFAALAAATIPTFAGVKYIDSDYADFAAGAANASAGGGRALDWFAQSGFTLPTLPHGGNGAPVFTWQVGVGNATYAAWARGDSAGAAAAQVRMLALDGIMAAFGGTPAARAAMKAFYGLDLGPIRPPQRDLTADQTAAFLAALSAGGFLPPLSSRRSDGR